MTSPAETAAVLAAARARAPRPARAAAVSPSAPPRNEEGAAPRERAPARPPQEAAPGAKPHRSTWAGHGLPVPLDEHQLRRIEALRELVGERYHGWGREQSGTFFVDVGEDRHRGGALHAALGEALRDARGTR